MSRLDDLATKLESAAEQYGQASFNHGCAIHENHGNDLRECQAEVGNTWVTVDDLIQQLRAWQQPDQRPDAVTITEDMIQRGAEKMWEIATGETWLRIGWGGPAKPPYINDARAVLEAALAPETPDAK